MSSPEVRVYRGIRYAEPPVGALRWRPPQPVALWTGPPKDFGFGPDPVQIVHVLPARRSLAPGVAEDCLTLNIWAPAEVPAGGAPVAVWFDGGGFIAMSGARQRITGDAYARRGIVFVTANYRVGVFGYLAHPALSAESPHHVSGNYGLLDTIAALRWVRENIAAFGGDPQRVTAFGGSAGAAHVALQLTSPLAKGLIDRVILRAPSALRPVATLAEAEELGRRVAGDDLAAMRALPAEALLAWNEEIDPGGGRLTEPRPLRPLIDGWAIPQREIDAYRSGAFAAVPMIVGNAAGEGDELIADVPTTAVAHGNESLAGSVRTVEQLRGWLRRMFGPAFDEAWTFYGAKSDADVHPRLANAWGDMMSNYGVRILAREMAKRQPRTFRFLFSHAGAYTLNPPGHGDDMLYAYGTGEFDARDQAVSDAMIAAFANFITNGDPNGPGAPPWTPYDPARENVLAFDNGFPELTGWRTEQSAFAERVYDLPA
jgi:para-nitrobenzyl esterase